MQQFIATIVVFLLAGLAMGIGMLFGKRGVRLGCHGQSEDGKEGSCGSSCCCSGGQPQQSRPLVTIDKCGPQSDSDR